jgi:hypothetical protein
LLCTWRPYQIIVKFVYLLMMENDFVWHWMRADSVFFRP